MNLQEQYVQLRKKFKTRLSKRGKELAGKLDEDFLKMKIELCHKTPFYGWDSNHLAASYATGFLTLRGFRKKCPDYQYYRRMLDYIDREKDRTVEAVLALQNGKLAHFDEMYNKYQALGKVNFSEKPKASQGKKEEEKIVGTTGARSQALALMAGEVLDLVPTQIGPQTLAIAGQTEKYLIDFCQRNEVALRDLQTLISYKNDYRTNFPTLERFLERGRSLDEISMLLLARELVAGGENPEENEEAGAIGGSTESATLEALDNFYQRFGRNFPPDAEYLAGEIQKVHGRLNSPYLGMSVQAVLDKAEELGGDCSLETILDLMTGAIWNDPAVQRVITLGEFDDDSDEFKVNHE